MGPLFLDSPPTLAYLCCSAQLARIMSQLACGGGGEPTLLHSSLGLILKQNSLKMLERELCKVPACLVSSPCPHSFLECHIQATSFREDGAELKRE